MSLARANWDTGYFQAAVYKTLLEELGYSVTDPSAAELIPAEFYPALAEAKYDLWVNGWFPLHDEFLAGELPSGSLVGDNDQKIGAEMPAGGLQGFVIDVATATKYGITMLDDIGNDPAIAALFDTDGDGKADITGCNEGWGCQITINDTIEFNGWSDTIEQKSGDYPALWAEVVVHAGRESRFWRTRGRRAPTSRSSSLGRMCPCASPNPTRPVLPPCRPSSVPGSLVRWDSLLQTSTSWRTTRSSMPTRRRGVSSSSSRSR